MAVGGTSSSMVQAACAVALQKPWGRLFCHMVDPVWVAHRTGQLSLAESNHHHSSQHLRPRTASRRRRYMLHADGDDDEPGMCEQPEHSDRAGAEALVKDPLRTCWPCAQAPRACGRLSRSMCRSPQASSDRRDCRSQPRPSEQAPRRNQPICRRRPLRHPRAGRMHGHSCKHR